MSSPDSIKEDRAKYWDNKIRRWAESSYDEDRDDTMAKLRTSIDARKNEAMKLLDKHYDDTFSLLDLGCGAGQFVIEVAKRGWLSFGHGWDFAEDGIKFADELRDAEGLPPEEVQFKVAGVDEEWPDVDVITGLGLLDWLDEDQIDDLFSRLKGRKFIFSFSEQDNSLAEIVHRVYLVWRLKLRKDNVRAYHHKRQFFFDLAKKYDLGELHVHEAKEMRFGRLLHNLE
jgi:SAM-dependent methyltransferase